MKKLSLPAPFAILLVAAAMLGCNLTNRWVNKKKPAVRHCFAQSAAGNTATDSNTSEEQTKTGEPVVRRYEKLHDHRAEAAM